MTTALLLFGSMALFILIGVPIAFALGAAVWSTIVFSPDFTVTVGIIAQRIFGGLESTSIMAIPFFILAGNLMTKGGISRRLVNFANCIVGNVRGGMALALVLACAFFAALSGSAPATVIAIGSMLYPEMVRMGYPKDRTAGLLVVSGGLGPIIPPSIIMVVYATITGASIGDMFSSGMFIGDPAACDHPGRHLLRSADPDGIRRGGRGLGPHCRYVHLPGALHQGPGSHFPGLRQGLGHDPVHHRDVHGLLLDLRLLRNFR